MELNKKEYPSNEISKLTLSQIVAANYRAAAVFEKYNLDFCCGGNKQVSIACKEKGLNSSTIFEELEFIGERRDSSNKFNEWSPDFLIDYIINNHHSYVTKMIPVISEHTKKINSVHGKNHSELSKVESAFERVYKDLKQHMMKEEQILFPFIKYLVSAKNNGRKAEPPYFGTVKNPIKMMEAEHQAAGDQMHEIRNLTQNYIAPDDACETYKATMFELKEFEEDLHKHVYLENYILFPKSVKLETELL
jgi:regulator of cell morphogenesis and NO signaling